MFPCDYHDGDTVDPQTKKCTQCGYDYSSLFDADGNYIG
jgi:hypothetical protein